MSFEGFVPRIRLQIYKTARKSVKLTRSLDETAILCIVFPSEKPCMGRPEGCCQARCLHNKVTHTLASQAKQSYCSLWTSPKIGCTPSCFFVGIRLPDHAVLQFWFPGRFVLTSPVVFAKIFERLGKERRTALLSVQILIWSGIEVVITGLTRNLAGSCPFRPPKTL